MHRSGTSLTTRIVNLLGADIAGDLIPAGIGNERGHWESRAVQALHNRMLAELASDIYSPLNIPAEWFGSAAALPWIGRMRDLLAEEYAHSALFVLKDPRIALFLPLWLEAMRELAITPKFVVPFRSPEVVARSLRVRENRLESGRLLPEAQGIAVWLRYVLAAERSTRDHARAFVAYDDLLADWRSQFARVGRQLAVEWPQWRHADAQIDEFIDAGIHDADVTGSTESGAHVISRNVYAGLQQAVAEPHSVQPAFDAAAQVIADAESLLGSYVAATGRESSAIREHADAGLRRHEVERAQMHRRFETELGLRDERIAHATAHAQGMEESLKHAIAHAKALEHARNTAVDHAQSVAKDRDDAVARVSTLQIAHDEAIARIQILERECGDASRYARSLEEQREHSSEYVESLKQSRDEAVRYAQSLEEARAGGQGRAPQKPAHGGGCVFFTIASRNYLAYALTLMQSVAQHHPDAPRYLILADRNADDATLVDAPFVTIPAEALALPDFEAFAFRYTIMEFNTALKPYAFAHLRQLHPGAGIVYLDPDILVLEPLAGVEAALANGALAVLTPHLLEPVDDDHQPGEREILASGTYNCGFVAISAHVEAGRLIDWWARRLEFGAVSDIASGLFTDQKWVDLVPGLFPDVHILRDDGYNLAYWNLSQRPVSRQGTHWKAAGRPLVFVHFSGVDPDHPARFSKHQNRHTQATIGPLRPLYAEYLARLAANGHALHRVKPYAFGCFADGEPICDPVRAVYRRYFDKGAAQPRLHPFSMDRSVYDVPCEEVPARADAPITRVMYATWKMRTDLRRTFDIGEAEGRDGFIRWFVRTAGAEMGIPARHLDAVRRALYQSSVGDAQAGASGKWRSAPAPLRRAGSACLDVINWSCRHPLALRFYALIPESTRNRIRHRLERLAFAANMAKPATRPGTGNMSGINLVGYAHGEFGVAEILRRHAQTLQDGGVPFVVRNFDVGVASRQLDRSMQAFLSEECRYDVNLFCINADQMPVARQHLGDAVFAGRYNIGCWFWELEKFPEQWHGATDLVDEIWVASPFVRDAIAACTSKPVHIVPVALGLDLPDARSRAEFGLPDDAFVCLFSFDFNSFATRKNAEAAITAFRRAFDDGRSDARLLIKTVNGERFPDALRKLLAAADGDERIEVRDGFLDRNDMRALQGCSDCYISLHRSEGLGLGMAECMLLGKPVVATAYSGNLAFMDANNSCLVGYTLVPVEDGEYPDWKGQSWAEPDIDQAAAYLRRLADDPAYARRIGENAKASAREHLSASASMAAIAARLADIRSQQLAVPAS